jgi:hypothetical protein
MSEMQYPQLPSPLAERPCGNCNVCCYALTIDEPALAKPQGVRCSHTQSDLSCGIYDKRPATCRAFWCGWRLFRWVRANLRPDESGVLIRAQFWSPPGENPRPGVVFSLLTPQSLEAEGLLESMAAAIAGGLVVHVSIPGPAGYTASTGRIDEVLADAVIRRDKPGMMAILKEALKEGQSGPRRKIVLRHALKEEGDTPTLH